MANTSQNKTFWKDTISNSLVLFSPFVFNSVVLYLTKMEGISFCLYVCMYVLWFSWQPLVWSTSLLVGALLRTQGSAVSSGSSWHLQDMFISSVWFTLCEVYWVRTPISCYNHQTACWVQLTLCRLLQYIQKQMKKERLERLEMLHYSKLKHDEHQQCNVFTAFNSLVLNS